MKRKTKIRICIVLECVAFIIFLVSILNLIGWYDNKYMTTSEGLMISLIIYSISLIDRCKMVLEENKDLRGFIRDIHEKINED